jgi:hypothetical protein
MFNFWSGNIVQYCVGNTTGRGQALGKPHIGAIFVELAIVMPVLIAIIYYLHDIPKCKRIQKKMEFCLHCAVNILSLFRSWIFENIVNKRLCSCL